MNCLIRGVTVSPHHYKVAKPTLYRMLANHWGRCESLNLLVTYDIKMTKITLHCSYIKFEDGYECFLGILVTKEPI